jgi:hypothetical protein
MSIVDQLHPIAFEWKADHKRDIGFGAEDVEQIDRCSSPTTPVRSKA